MSPGSSNATTYICAGSQRQGWRISVKKARACLNASLKRIEIDNVTLRTNARSGHCIPLLVDIVFFVIQGIGQLVHRIPDIDEAKI